MGDNVLSDEQIADLLSRTRVRGFYKAELDGFLARGEKGEDVTERCNGKVAATVKVGFDSQIKKHELNVRCHNDEGRIVLINRDLV